MRAYSVFMWLFEASVGACVLVGLILLVRKTLRGALGSKLVYALWLLVVLRLLLPIQLPSLLLPTVQSSAGTVSVTEAAERQVRLMAHEWSEALATSVAEQPYDRITDASIATYNALQPNTRGYVWLGLYLLGAVLTGGWMLFQNHRFRRYLKRHSIGPLDGEAATVYAHYAAALHLRPPAALMIDPLDSACLVGGFRPVIALPVTDNGDPYILLHELSHYKNGDAIWGIFRNVCCALFWFHPLVWLAAHISRADCELACDERVSARLNPRERAAYAELLVRLAACRRTPRAGVLATGMSMTGTRLKLRVRQILSSRKVKLWALVVAGMLSLATLTTCFATATVLPPEIASGLTNSAPVTQDAWLKRDASLWFPNSDFTARIRDNTSVSTRYGDNFLLDWAYSAGYTVASAALSDRDPVPYPIKTNYAVGLNDETTENCSIAAIDDARWQSLRDCYYSYEAVYSVDGALLCIVRNPRVSALCRRIVLRSAGQTISGLEYSVRYQDVLAQYNSWVQAHQNQFDEAIAAAQAQAMQIGWPVTTVVATAYQEAWDMSDPVALQNITLQTPNGQQAAFSVEMESWRVLAISFSDDFINGITADANNAGTDADLATDAQKPRNEALLRQTAYTALKQYFDYTPAVGDAVTLSPAGDADDEGSGWELVVAQPKGNFRYHVELGINGTLRRAMRTVCGMDFSESCSEYGFPYLNEHPERYHLSAKTLFWLNSGASDADGQTLPPEVLSAMAAADAYIRDKGLPFSQHTGYSLSWVDRWLLQREGDIGIEFTYRKGEGDQGYRLVYSTLQQAISAVDFGDTGIALQNGSL